MFNYSPRLMLLIAAAMMAGLILPANAGSVYNFGNAPPTSNFSEQFNAYVNNLYKYHEACNKTAFDHDLQNLAALADIMGQVASREAAAEMGRLTASGKYPNQAGIDKQMNKERDDATAGKAGATNAGAAYADSLAINLALADFRKFDWKHCQQTSMSSATIGVDYANYSPSSGSNESQYGLNGGILTAPLWGGSVVKPAQGGDLGDISAPGLDLDAGYHHSTSTGPDTNSWTVGTALVWTAPEWRFGPAVGFQSSSTGSFNSQNWNYGAFAEWFATDQITAFAKAGGFSGNWSSNGFYIGGSGKYYAAPDFALNAGIDYTRWTSFGGSDELDYTIGGEYLFSETTPISLYGGYVRSDYTGNYSIDQFFVGLRFYLNGDGVNSLEDRQRGGNLGPHQFKF